MRLKDKVALITGASSGIGRATAILFAKEGAKVVIVCRTSSTGEDAVRVIKNNGGEAMFVCADVSKPPDVRKMIESAVENYGKLDILFNNAGGARTSLIIETKEDEWNSVVDVNLKGVFLGCKYAVPVMIKQGGGAIINTASTFAFVGAPRFSAYCASKGGVVALSRAIALEVAQYRIRVNCVCPGTIETPRVERQFIESGKPDEMRKTLLKSFPIGRLGRPEDVAYAVLYLASDESSFVTGTVLFVDGGYTAQ